MMTAPFLMLWLTRSTKGFRAVATIPTRRSTTRLLSLTSLVETNISRLSTLQTLLVNHGAPGSDYCNKANDLEPIGLAPSNDTPELLTSMASGEVLDAAFTDLHPFLFPIAKSKSTGNLVCAYRSPSTEESDKNYPWPIVESSVGAPGMKLLSLNSEHLMRRIVCEVDEAGSNEELIDLYNRDLGRGNLRDAALDAPYEIGSVAKLGYGVDKYVLLRVGPFQDLYEQMAMQHAARGDEQSSLIAAEAASGKLPGFASSFRFYARLLNSFPNRSEETRDAARMCLRMPLPTIGQSIEDIREVAVLGQLCDESADNEHALSKIQHMYKLIRETEEEDPQKSDKTETQKVLEEVDHLLNEALLERRQWGTTRPALSDLFRSIGREAMASFVEVKSA